MKVNGCERHTVEAVHTTQISIQWQFIVTANLSSKKDIKNIIWIKNMGKTGKL